MTADPLSPQEISKLIGSIYDCALDPSRWELTLDEMRGAFDGLTAMLHLNDLHHDRLLLHRTVGLEPYALDLIAKQGISFDFPARARLFEVRSQKLSKIPPEYLYHKAPSSLLHSLEAFYGDPAFDYDRIAHHKVMGSFMSSPSATAAYLMRCSKWDHEAEAYLRLVIEAGAGRGLGGVPSAYPSTHFELTWVCSVT